MEMLQSKYTSNNSELRKAVKTGKHAFRGRGTRLAQIKNKTATRPTFTVWLIQAPEEIGKLQENKVKQTSIFLLLLPQCNQSFHEKGMHIICKYMDLHDNCLQKSATIFFSGEIRLKNYVFFGGKPIVSCFHV